MALHSARCILLEQSGIHAAADSSPFNDRWRDASTVKSLKMTSFAFEFEHFKSSNHSCANLEDDAAAALSWLPIILHICFHLQPCHRAFAKGEREINQWTSSTYKKRPCQALTTEANPYFIFPPFFMQIEGRVRCLCSPDIVSIPLTAWCDCIVSPPSLLVLKCSWLEAGCEEATEQSSWAQTWHAYFSSFRLHILEVTSLVSTHKWIA